MHEPELVKTITSFAFILLLLAWTIFIIAFPIRKLKDLSKDYLRDRFGSLYLGIRTIGVVQVLYTAVFCLRRLAMVLALLYLNRLPMTLLYTFMGIFTINLTYLAHARANEERYVNYIDVFNELC